MAHSGERLRVAGFEFAYGFIERGERLVDVFIGVREADARLFCGNRDLVDSSLNKQEAQGFVRCHVVLCSDVPPVRRQPIHQIDTTGTAQSGNVGAQSVTLEDGLLAALQFGPEILEACRRGDRDAFRTLYEAYKDRVYSMAYYFFHADADAAGEVTQQVFLKLMREMTRFRGDAAFSTWLYRLGVNACF